MTILLAGIVSGCIRSNEAETLEVKEIVTGIIAADNRADLETIMTYYHNDAALIPPGKNEIKSINSIRQNYESIFQSSRLNLSIEIQEIKVEEEVAVCYGRTNGQIISKSDSSIKQVNDKYMMWLEKQGGEWKIKRLMWN